ncbi:hypothetical protein IM40_11050 (plasmid) [Candidatus Paracaedimonas acanthamoebae]|nr:hypothetical protein IM40_11050 [Candidatus Paracaedimonas acanthamoebae]
MQQYDIKLSKLDEKILKLEKEKIELQKKKNEEFLSLLNKVPSLNLEPLTLIGGLLHVVDEANKKPELKEKWRQAAQKFCGRTLSRKELEKGSSSSQKSA